MIAAPSQIAIINGAAARLGSAQRISSITQPGNLAGHARESWDSAVRTRFADYPWSFAISRTHLEPLSAAPAFGYVYAYALPADCLRWLPPSREADDNYFEGELEGSSILTDFAPPLPIRYISKEKTENVGRWPAWFADAMEAEMASLLAEPLTQSANKAAAMADEAERLWKRAKRRDAQSSGNRQRHEIVAGSNWAATRYRPFNPRGR